MKTTYHFKSVQDIGEDFLEEIKANFKGQTIEIRVTEVIPNLELTDEQKAILDDRLSEDISTYIGTDKFINQLNKKFGI
jgi:hypothetical protein